VGDVIIWVGLGAFAPGHQDFGPKPKRQFLFLCLKQK